MIEARVVKVSISAVKTDHKRKLPHYVRWRVAGKQHWHSFPSKDGTEGANEFYAKLVQAKNAGQPFDLETGMPTALYRKEDAPVANLAQKFMIAEWQRLSPNTRRSYAEAMAAFTFAAIDPDARSSEPPGARTKFTTWLRPSGVDPKGRPTWPEWGDLDHDVRNWLEAIGLTAGQLDQATVKRIDSTMRRRHETGVPFAMTTQNRLINPTRRMIREAAELGRIKSVEWPKAKAGAKAKSEMSKTGRPDEKFPTTEGLRLIIQAIASHQPASKMYQALSAVFAPAKRLRSPSRTSRGWTASRAPSKCQERGTALPGISGTRRTNASPDPRPSARIARSRFLAQ